MASFKGVPPRRKDEKDYNREMHRDYLRPLLEGLAEELGKIRQDAPASVWIATATVFIDRWMANQDENFPRETVRRWVRKVNAYNENKFVTDIARVAKVDVRPALQRSAIGNFMEERIEENIALIKTIPDRYHQYLTDEFIKAEREAPFDQQRKEKLFREGYRKAGKKSEYDLRRVTRDQTNKLNGQLARERMKAVGIRQYKWRTSEDERVRESHRALNGTIHPIDGPGPAPDGHPGQGIQCRCVAIEHISVDELKRNLGVI